MFINIDCFCFFIFNVENIDFMFFNNGAFMETDALNIQQSGSKLFLLVNNNSIGYDLSDSDEIVAFGKFNA